MSYAPLDPRQAVILFADLQAGIIERSATNPLGHLRSAVSALARLAHLFEIPVVVTTAPAAEGTVQLTPEIEAALGGLKRHLRATTDAFLDPGTRDALTATGRGVVLVSGVATEIIVQHSALSALAHGLEVQVVVDACGGIAPRTEEAAFARLTQAGAALASVASVAAQLAGDLAQPMGREAMGILYELAAG